MKRSHDLSTRHADDDDEEMVPDQVVSYLYHFCFSKFTVKSFLFLQMEFVIIVLIIRIVFYSRDFYFFFIMSCTQKFKILYFV